MWFCCHQEAASATIGALETISAGLRKVRCKLFIKLMYGGNRAYARHDIQLDFDVCFEGANEDCLKHVF